MKTRIKLATDRNMQLRAKYPYIAKWGRLMRSLSYYVDRQLEEAEADNAPLDACYKTDSGQWKRFADIQSAGTRAELEAME